MIRSEFPLEFEVSEVRAFPGDKTLHRISLDFTGEVADERDYRPTLDVAVPATERHFVGEKAYLCWNGQEVPGGYAETVRNHGYARMPGEVRVNWEAPSPSSGPHYKVEEREEWGPNGPVAQQEDR